MTRERSRQRAEAQSSGFGLGRLLVGATVLAGLAYGGVELRRHALESPRFALSSVEVSGTSRTTKADVRELSGLRTGDNVFAVDLEAVESAIEALSWVKTAVAERRLPDAVAIAVVEHEPVALLSLDSLYYIDATGTAFRAYVPGEPIELPVLMGVDREGYRYGEAEAMARVAAGLEFLDAWRETRGSKASLPSEIEVSAPGLVRFTAPGGTSVWAGRSPWQGVLRRLGPLLDRIERGEEQIAEMYAGRGRRADRVVVQSRAQVRGAEER